MNIVKTAGERAREESLLNDPLVNLLSPSWVECKKCTKKIKLSSKSAYDTYHWRNHRKRCLRTVKKRKEEVSSRRRISSPLRSATSTKASTREPEPVSEPRRLQTPPLVEISDSEEDSVGSLITDTSHYLHIPSPSPPETASHSVECKLANTFRDYILRSHPESVQRTGVLPYHWQSWSWSQLKEPRFAVPAYDHSTDTNADEDREEECEYRYRRTVLQHLPRSGGPSRVVADIRDQEAAHALSMLSRSR